MKDIATEKKLKKLNLFSSIKNSTGPKRVKTEGQNVPKIRALQNSVVKGEEVFFYETKMKKIVTIGPGEAFGGMNFNSDTVYPRMAAILCDEDSEFLILERKCYNVSFCILKTLIYVRNCSGG